MNRKYIVRREIMNLTMGQWDVIGKVNEVSVTVEEWIKMMNGTGGFLTGKANAEERKFINLVYQTKKEKSK